MLFGDCVSRPGGSVSFAARVDVDLADVRSCSMGCQEKAPNLPQYFGVGGDPGFASSDAVVNHTPECQTKRPFRMRSLRSESFGVIFVAEVRVATPSGPRNQLSLASRHRDRPRGMA